MNLIFGVIILAMFILALRVIWATCLQLLVMLKIGIAAMNRYRMQRNARAAIPVFMPRISHEVDWEVMSDTVRKEIQQRNSGIGREAARLDVELQVKTKTMELIKPISKSPSLRWNCRKLGLLLFCRFLIQEKSVNVLNLLILRLRMKHYPNHRTRFIS